MRRRHAGGQHLQLHAGALQHDGDPADLFCGREETVPTEGPALMKIPALLVLIAVMVGGTDTGRAVTAQERQRRLQSVEAEIAVAVQELWRRSLRGLQGVEVVVEDMTPMATRYGLTRTQVQTDVELRIRRAGIHVFMPDEVLSTPGNASLYVNIHTVFGDGPATGLVGYSIDVELGQAVRLERDPDIWLPSAVTWSENQRGLVGRTQLHAVRAALSDLVDRFINAYYAANPERTPVQVPTPAPAQRPRKEKRR